MEIVRGKINIRPRHKGVVLTIGNFDGVHLGHQCVLDQVKDKAAELGCPTMAMIFEPQPQEYFTGEKAPPRLMRLRDKAEAMDACGVDYLFCERFTESFRALTAEQFSREYLVDGLAIRHLVIGDDFRFGKGRSQDYEYLEELGRKKGFTVENTKTVELDGERVSSTRIRQCLEDGDFSTAEKLLGRPYKLSGRIAYGDQIGRTLGFPTANITLLRMSSPLKGVFAVEIEGIDEKPLQAIANLGKRPTVGGEVERLEVHILDFDQDVYGKYVKVRFLKRLRPEKKFSGLEELKEAIASDVDSVRKFFNKQ